MSFQSGRVTFCRFDVTGDAPTSIDEAMLSILQEYRFQETQIGAPDEVEVGFVTPEHLLDTRFTFEKVGYSGGSAGGISGGRVLLGMRMDTHKVPADVRKAYRIINEQTSAAENPSGFATKGQKREALDLANQQVRDDLAKGMYRKSKVIPLLWDLSAGKIYCGATGNAVVEELARLFRRAFAIDLTLQSAGVAAGTLIKADGRTRDYEDLHPSPFTDPPATVRHRDEDTDGIDETANHPDVPWVAKSLDLKDFLGNEFLMWLWWKSETQETHEPHIKTPAGDRFVAFDRSLDLDCAWGLGGKVGIRGDGPTRLREAAEALRTGKWPRKAGLILSDGTSQWELTLSGDAWTVSGAKLPDVPDAQNPRELTEARLELTVQLADTLDALYSAFLQRRAGGTWPHDRDAIRAWIKQRRQTPTRNTPAPATASATANTTAASATNSDADATTTTPEPVIVMKQPPAPQPTA